MRRCFICEHIIWLWQRYGWFMVEGQRPAIYFHQGCLHD